MDAGNIIQERYEVRRCIGRGTRGEVYEALDTLLGDVVALKILPPGALEPEGARERLLEEIRLARRVTHPNVCRVLEFGIDRTSGGGDLPFVTMERLCGEPLAARLERVGWLEPELAREILLQVLSGLEAIHRAGIVHGHLNPEHVFLCRNDRKAERPVLMSFGLARTIEDAGSGAPGADVQAAGRLLSRMLKPQREHGSRAPREPFYGLAPALLSGWPTLARALRS
jgi:serine/threonine protein kinase